MQIKVIRVIESQVAPPKLQFPIEPDGSLGLALTSGLTRMRADVARGASAARTTPFRPLRGCAQ